jgi:hypothetical protein
MTCGTTLTRAHFHKWFDNIYCAVIINFYGNDLISNSIDHCCCFSFRISFN